MPARYVTIDDSVINEPRSETIDGVEVTVMLSPFDVPWTASCEQDEQADVLHLKFTYIGSKEPLRWVEFEGGGLQLGKRSGRVYEMEVSKEFLARASAEANPVEGLRYELTQVPAAHQNKAPSNFEAVGNILKEYGQDLISPAEPLSSAPPAILQM